MKHRSARSCRRRGVDALALARIRSSQCDTPNKGSPRCHRLAEQSGIRQCRAITAIKARVQQGHAGKQVKGGGEGGRNKSRGISRVQEPSHVRASR